MKHNTLKLFCSIVLSFIPIICHAQINGEDLLLVSNEGLSKASSAAEASREIQAKIIAGVAREPTLEMIGEKRFQKGKSLVESRIVR